MTPANMVLSVWPEPCEPVPATTPPSSWARAAPAPPSRMPAARTDVVRAERIRMTTPNDLWTTHRKTGTPVGSTPQTTPGTGGWGPRRPGDPPLIPPKGTPPGAISAVLQGHMHALSG